MKVLEMIGKLSTATILLICCHLVNRLYVIIVNFEANLRVLKTKKKKGFAGFLTSF